MTLSKHITNVQTLNDKDISSIPVVKIKDFIKKIKEHSFTTDEGLRVVDVNWIDQEAGDKLT